jgi:uncharacterized membrane protein YhaH (DUF805 family)
MKGLLLQNAAQVDAGGLGALLGIFLGFAILFFVISLAVYVYTALAFMKLAKKTNTPNGWMAWIPIVNLFLISKMAKMHWWPILLLIIPLLVGIISPFLGETVATILGLLVFVSYLVLIVFAFIWQWKVFEAVGRPGWWVLLAIIPFVGTLIYLILLGVAAWGNPKG